MKEETDSQQSGTKDQLADLLKHGKPRAPAPEVTRARAFQHLHAHWSERIQRKRKRRKAISWGIAASTIFACVILVNTVNNDGGAPGVRVAEIVRTSGADVRLQTDRSSQPMLATMADSLSANSSLITGTDSRLALAWSKGGSLRVDQDTEMKLVSPERIRLVIGTVYFDSIPNSSAASEPKSFLIETPYGLVTHIGTQFATRITDDGLTISVREGEVTVESDNGRLLISAGEEFDIGRAGLREERHVEAYSDQWQWVQNIAPTFDAEDRSAYDLLRWIGRETGHKINYSSDAVADFARQGSLTGMDGLAPMHALKALPYATDLHYNIDDGVIQINLKEVPDSNPQTTPDGR